MAKILITGASGFIGGHLARAALDRGHEVTCLVRRSSSVERLRQLDAKLAYGELCDRESLAAAVRGQDAVLQLAGCLYALRRADFYRVNGNGLRNLAWACAQQTTPPVLVLISSMAAMGPARDGKPRRETDPPAPVSHYGQSKLAGEQAAREFADRVPISIVRPPVVFGEGDLATLEIFKRVAWLGVHFVPSWRNHRVSLIHADDLATVLLLAAERGGRVAPRPADLAAAAKGCYFAACDEHPTYAEWGLMIGAALGRRRTRIVHAGPLAVSIIAGAGSATGWISRRPRYFNWDKAREARAGSWHCSTEAAAVELGFAPAASLRQRIEQTVRWYLENGWL
jgi:dihydroflavonol-4-reductase